MAYYYCPFLREVGDDGSRQSRRWRWRWLEPDVLMWWTGHIYFDTDRWTVCLCLWRRNRRKRIAEAQERSTRKKDKKRKMRQWAILFVHTHSLTNWVWLAWSAVACKERERERELSKDNCQEERSWSEDETASSAAALGIPVTLRESGGVLRPPASVSRHSLPFLWQRELQWPDCAKERERERGDQVAIAPIGFPTIYCAVVIAGLIITYLLIRQTQICPSDHIRWWW